MSGRTGSRFQTTRRRPMKPYLFFSTVLILSLYFATAIDGFSPISRPFRLKLRERNNRGDFLHRNGVLSPHTARGVAAQRRITNLRGGFMLPITASPILKSIGIYTFLDLVVGFFISAFTGSHVHLDLIGTGAFAVAALPYLQSSVAHIRWSSAAVFLWGSKLALFLFFRATKVKHDKRLASLLSTTEGAFQFWFITLVWNVMTSLPYLFGLGCDRDNNVALVSGGILYLAGLIIESLSDGQKYIFKQQLSSANQFCNVGLWKYSQHPNWFGNLLLWTGILVMNLPALIEPLSAGAEHEGAPGLLLRLWSVRKLLLACLGPAFLWSLFNAQATGSMSSTVELANAKYGKDPEYVKYVETVPLIIPNLKFWK